MLRQPPALHGIRRARWRLRDLRQVVPWLRRYTLPGLCRLLQRLRIRWKRGRLRVHSPDRAYATKLAWIARAHQQARAQPAHVRLCYGDEFSLYRQPTLSGTYAAVGTEPTAPLSHRANTRQRLSAALEVASGRVVWTAGAKMGVHGLCQFLTALRRAYPTQTLLLVWDNWPVHQHPTVLDRAAREAIQLLWLPTYAPWANPIEKLWRWLKQEHLHHHRLAADWTTLQTDVACFLNQFAHGSPALLRYVGLLPS